ncbi:uncharacterized protein LOC127790086 [Diospyros lotus]|uniref:uncharacterized protein LOC127790086 n=1 Tax=Diospyros lotus TaxID=55363 RepID=UPI00225573F5|nr:uncharacterized protein LOC127790086 [Diospyros lotus]
MRLMDSPEMTPTPDPPLHRRNSITAPVVVPGKLKVVPTKTDRAASFTTTIFSDFSTSCSSSSSVDFELIPMAIFKPPSYTSLRDLLPGASSGVQSPSCASYGGNSGYEISIRNRLVKQAAWAYLQPMSTSPGAPGDNFLRRLWAAITGRRPFAAFFRFFTRTLSHALDCLVGALPDRSSR